MKKLMKNIINYPIDFSLIPNDIKKYLYIHDDICRGVSINSESDKEELVEIFDDEIKINAFWNDEIIYTGDQEIDDLLNLEGIEMQNYIKKNGGKFGIFVRKTVKEKLLEIDKNLKSKGYYLALKAGYRPIEVQKNLFKKIYKYFEKKFSNFKEEEIYDKTTEMISNPDRDISPHTTGGAVDVILYDKDGNLVDMGCPVNFIGEESSITTDNINDIQRKNREILQNAFFDAGFSSLASEWWHFSYGDPYWAVFCGKNEALYGVVQGYLFKKFDN